MAESPPVRKNLKRGEQSSLFCTGKVSDVVWEYEKEWRIIVIPQDIENTTKKKWFLPLKPMAIYYGLRFEEQPEKVKSTIRELAKSKGLHQYKMELKEDDRCYLITPILID